MIIKTSYSFMKPPPSARLIRGHRLSQGFVGLWTMAENGGLQVSDLSGGNTGTFAGDPTWEAGSLGSAIYFDGNDSISLAKNASPASLPLTVIARFKIDDNTIGQRIIDSDGSTNYAGCWLQVTTSGKIHIGYGDNIGTSTGNRRSGIGNTVLSTNTYYTVVGVIRGATDMSVYINGIDDGISSYSGTGGVYAQGTTPGFIGKLYWNGSSYYMTGSISYVNIYNRALSASEIPELYIRPFVMFERKARTALMSGYEVVAPPVGMAGAMTTNTGFWGY